MNQALKDSYNDIIKINKYIEEIQPIWNIEEKRRQAVVNWPAPPKIHRGLEWPQCLNCSVFFVLCLSSNFLISYHIISYHIISYHIILGAGPQCRLPWPWPWPWPLLSIITVVMYCTVLYCTVLYCTGPYIAIHSHDVSMSIITAIIL